LSDLLHPASAQSATTTRARMISSKMYHHVAPGTYLSRRVAAGRSLLDLGFVTLQRNPEPQLLGVIGLTVVLFEQQRLLVADQRAQLGIRLHARSAQPQLIEQPHP